MTRRPPSSRSDRCHSAAARARLAATLAVVAVGACAHASPTPRPASVSQEDAPRRAPGVVASPAAARPSAGPPGATSSGVVALRAPPDDAFTRELVARFFAAVVAEDTSALAALFATEARVGSADGVTGWNALRAWEVRLARLDYRALAGHVVYRPADVTVFRGERAVALGAHRAQIAWSVPPDAVLVRVPIVTPRAGTVTLFADELWFVLMPGEKGYRIAWLFESTSVP